jgi:hypothetical protein
MHKYTPFPEQIRVPEAFAKSVIARYIRVDVPVNNAPSLFIGIDQCSDKYEAARRPFVFIDTRTN